MKITNTSKDNLHVNQGKYLEVVIRCFAAFKTAAAKTSARDGRSIAFSLFTLSSSCVDSLAP